MSLLRENADEDELIIYASGEYIFIHAVVVSNDKLTPVDQDDLLHWSCNPYKTIAGYVSGGGREDVWIERGMHSSGAKTLEDARQLVFGRTFDGWTGDDRTYFEILQEYAHLADIHWRSEQRAYCRFDEHGDIDPVVSITTDAQGRGVTLVSLKREPLELYLAASDSSLVRMFDFTLLRHESFSGWPDGAGDVFSESDSFFYRQKIAAGHAAYTRGAQIVRIALSPSELFSSIRDKRFGRCDTQYVDFIAYDCRNKRVAKISTDPTATTNYFEAKGNSLPFELSPAFFRPEVLSKYKGDRDKYTVGPRDIHCRSAWALRGYDVNEAGQVHAYICDLRNLPYSEQLHWASYNERPKASISQRALDVDFMNKRSRHPDPLQDVLRIARRWADDNVSWWSLRGRTLLGRLSTPRTASRDEWAEAFLDLSKLIVEGFDVKAIRAKLVEMQLAFEKDEGSLVLIERLLAAKSSSDSQRLEGLRTVQLIRSKVKGHSGGSEATELAHQALKQHETFTGHFEHVCKMVADELNRIEGPVLLNLLERMYFGYPKLSAEMALKRVQIHSFTAPTRRGPPRRCGRAWPTGRPRRAGCRGPWTRSRTGGTGRAGRGARSVRPRRSGVLGRPCPRPRGAWSS